MGVCRGRRWGCTFTTPPRPPTPTPAHRQLPFTFLQDPKQQRAFPRASVHCSTVLTPLYTTGVGSCPAPSTPFLVPRGHGAVGACSENGGEGGGTHTPWFVCTDLRLLSPGRAWKARMRCLESLDRVQAASFAPGSGGERRDVRGCGEGRGGGWGCPEPLRVPTAAASKPGANPKPQPAALPLHRFHAWQRDPAPPSITFRPCTKPSLHILDPIPSHSYGHSSAGAALFCSACSTGAAIHPPPPLHGSASE